ncbi:MAG: tetratricopeptide repeat protein [Chloroflexota bacterium]
MAFDVRVLGAMRVEQDGQPVSKFRSKKALTLLGYLIVMRRPVPRTRLAYLFWGEDDEQRARGELRRTLSNLTSLLPGCLVVDKTSAAFQPTEECTVDLWHFEQLITRSLVDWLPLSEAAELHQGEVMEGLYLDDCPEFESWLLTIREQHQQQYITILNTLTQHYTQIGEYHNALRYVSSTLESDPLREDVQQHMMLLLARTGQWNAALAQYETCAQLLTTELGVTPTEETTALYQRIKVARSQPRHNVPVAPTDFIGRQRELAELALLLRDPTNRLITITGIGGVGKTRLASEAGRTHMAHVLNGVRYVSLEGIHNPDLLITAIGRTFGIRFAERQTPQEQLLHHLSQQETLLILDNFEHLIDEIDLIVELLQRAPEITLLVTSREPLQLREEVIFALDGLPFPPSNTTHPEKLTSFETVQLFTRSAQRVNRHFKAKEELPGIADVCRLLAGLPLGIELAAALVNTNSCMTIYNAIRQNMDTLASTWRNVPERHRSLRAVFEHSWYLLKPAEQALFKQLAVFQGGFTKQAALTITGSTKATFEALIGKALLSEQGTSEEAQRYIIHPVLRQYAIDILALIPEEEQAIYASHADFYTALLQSHQTRSPHTIEPDMGNCRMAWQWHVEQQHFKQLHQSAAPLHRFYEAKGWFQEGYHVFIDTVEALRPSLEQHLSAEQMTWGKLTTHLAALLIRIGQLREAQTYATQGLALLRSSDMDTEIAFNLNILGITQLHLGDLTTAETILQECLALYQKAHSRAEQVKPLANLGSVYGRTGDYDRALQMLNQGLDICREIGDAWGEGLYLNNIAAIHHVRGDFAQARVVLETCLPISDNTKNQLVQLNALYCLGEMDLKEGQHANAQTHGQEALQIAHELDDQRTIALTLKLLGVATHQLGDQATAWTHLQEGLRIAATINIQPTILDVLDGVTRCLMAEGRKDQAGRLAQYIAYHPATEQQYRDNAKQILNTLHTHVASTKEMTEQPALHYMVQEVLSDIREQTKQRVMINSALPLP